MFYTFSYTPILTDTEANPHLLDMQLVAGVIHHVGVLFQDGCEHKEFVQITLADFQLWPSNRGESLRGNATVISFREFFELVPGNSLVTAKIWTTLTADFKEILIQVGVLPGKIIRPFQLEDLLNLAMSE